MFYQECRLPLLQHIHTLADAASPAFTASTCINSQTFVPPSSSTLCVKPEGIAITIFAVEQRHGLQNCLWHYRY